MTTDKRSSKKMVTGVPTRKLRGVREPKPDPSNRDCAPTGELNFSAEIWPWDLSQNLKTEALRHTDRHVPQGAESDKHYATGGCEIEINW